MPKHIRNKNNDQRDSYKLVRFYIKCNNIFDARTLFNIGVCECYMDKNKNSQQNKTWD